jgi:hypothetical protein
MLEPKPTIPLLERVFGGFAGVPRLNNQPSGKII